MMISVVIPIWKRHIQLALMLAKLNEQAQNLSTNLEVILCDSHSGEDIDLVVEHSKNTHNSLTIVHTHTQNIVAAKRNHGVHISTGEFIVFLDDDCIPSPDFLQSLLGTIRNLKVDTVYCGEVRFEEKLVNKSNYYRYRDSKHPIYKEDVLTTFNEWTFVSMNSLVPRDIFKKYNIFYNEKFVGYGCEDHEFPWKLREKGVAIEFSKQKIIHHEYNGSISQYANKIRCTARDGMFVLLHTTPDIILGNRRLWLIEKFLSKENYISKCIRFIFFNDSISKKVASFLQKNDTNKKYYYPKLFKYVLLCAYVNGISERGKIDRAALLNNWYI